MALQKSTYNSIATWEGLKRLFRLRRSTRGNYPQGHALIHFEVSLEAGDLDLNDEVLVGNMPVVDNDVSGIYLLGFRAELTDVDTNGTPTHVVDFMADANVLISGSTIGQAGGVDELDANSDMLYEDIAGMDIKMKSTTAAATGAAGTLGVWLEVAINKFSETGS